MRKVTMKNKNTLFGKGGMFRTALLLLCCSILGTLTAYTQDRYRVEGTVTDDRNKPLEGVTVIALGTKGATGTDKNGHYSLSASGNNARLLFSYVGYESKQVNVGGQPVVNVVLAIQSGQLNEVVVTGYGKSKKKDVTGAVTAVNADDFNKGVISSPAMLLQGKVAGLVISKSGNPNQSPQIVLRGPSTLRSGAAQEPFYVIDGVPGASIDLVAPDDIERIDVLKDGASTAIYGARASNGVIMVTTRKARPNQTQIAYNAYVSAEQVSNRLKVLTGDELRKYLADNGQTLAPANNDTIPGTGKLVNTDWQKEVQRTAVSTNHNLSIMGNANKTSYTFSVTYLNNQGIIRGTSMNKLNTRFSIDQKLLNDRLRLAFSVADAATTQNDVPPAVYNNMLNYLPTVLPVRPDGTYTEDYTGNLRGGNNPLALIANNTNVTKGNTFLANALAEVTILPGLQYTASLSTQRQHSENGVYYNSLSTLARGVNGRAYRNSYNNINNIIESFFNYDRTFGSHTIKLLAGYSWQQQMNGDGFGVTTQGFVSDALSYNNLGLSNPPNGTVSFDNTNLTPLKLISYYARAGYNFRDRYMFQASLRNDGSSAFGKNNQWGYFPAVSAGWRISSEPFARNISFLNDLKLRVSYGVSGNSLGFDPLIAQLQYGTIGRYYDNGQYLNAIAPVQNQNPDLKWERTGMLNAGFDFTILNGRVSGAVDYYDKQTSDLIWQYPVSVTQFISTTLSANVGKVTNRGVEVVLNAIPVKTSKFTWNTSLNVAHNVNQISSLANDRFTLTAIPTAILGGKGQSGNWSQIIREGYPLGTFALWHYMGKDSNGVSTFRTADGKVTTSPSSADLAPGGDNAQPTMTFGFNNNFSYRNFDLNLFFRGMTGNKVLNATLASLNTPTDAKRTNIARFTLSDSYNDKNSYLISDRFLEDGSYVRLENATIGYTFKWESVYFRSLRLYFNVNNVLTWTRYRGIDPEVNIGGLTPGIDANNYYPKTRSYVLGLNVRFK